MPASQVMSFSPATKVVGGVLPVVGSASLSEPSFVPASLLTKVKPAGMFVNPTLYTPGVSPANR